MFLSSLMGTAKEGALVVVPPSTLAVLAFVEQNCKRQHHVHVGYVNLACLREASIFWWGYEGARVQMQEACSY